MLDWDDLRFFLAVARHGSLSAAARSLEVAQPTVGRRVSGFERKLGARLFVPTPTGQALSKTGRSMLAHAERMELDVLAVERLATGRDAGVRGHLCITASEWMINRVLSPLLAGFLRQNPGIELELLAEPRHLSLVRREADLAVRPSKFEHHEVIQREIARLSFGLYAAESYLAERGVPDFAAQCEGHSLICMSEALGRVPDVTWLPQIAAKARVVVRTNGREAMARLASAGVGLTCLPRPLGDALPQLQLLTTPTAGPERKLWLGVHRDARAVPRIRASMTWLVEGFARLHPALSPDFSRASTWHSGTLAAASELEEVKNPLT